MSEAAFERAMAGLVTKWYPQNELPQGSEPWLKKREGHLTATDIAHHITGGSTADLHRKKNLGYKTPVTPAMEMGTKFEAEARAIHNQHFPKAEPICASKGIFWASLDGWDAENQEILEIKCVSRGRESSMWADVEEGRCPERVYWQAQVQMVVTGAQRARLFVYDPQSTLWLHHYIHASKRDQAVLHLAAEELWQMLEVRTDGDFVAAAQ
jgi:putative phage-type endonuclease